MKQPRISGAAFILSGVVTPGYGDGDSTGGAVDFGLMVGSGVVPAFCAIAYIASDKIATAIAVALLMSPDFIIPFSSESLCPTGWVIHAEPVPTEKGLRSTDEVVREIFKRCALVWPRCKPALHNSLGRADKQSLGQSPIRISFKSRRCFCWSLVTRHLSELSVRRPLKIKQDRAARVENGVTDNRRPKISPG